MTFKRSGSLTSGLFVNAWTGAVSDADWAQWGLDYGAWGEYYGGLGYTYQVFFHPNQATTTLRVLAYVDDQPEVAELFAVGLEKGSGYQVRDPRTAEVAVTDQPVVVDGMGKALAGPPPNNRGVAAAVAQSLQDQTQVDPQGERI